MRVGTSEGMHAKTMLASPSRREVAILLDDGQMGFFDVAKVS